MSSSDVLAPDLEVSGNQTQKTSNKVGLTWQGRPGASTCQWGCLAIYIVLTGVFIFSGINAVASQNMMVVHPDAQCPRDWWRRGDPIRPKENSYWCVAPALKEPWEKCQAKEGPKELEEERSERVRLEVETEDMFSMLGSNIAITGTIFPSVVFIAVGWFFALKNFPKAVVFGTIGIGVILLVILGVHQVNRGGTVKAGQITFGCAAVILLLTGLMRKQISFICTLVAAACTILKMRLSIFAAAFVLKLFWVCMLSLYFWFALAADRFVEVKETPFPGAENSQPEIFCSLEPTAVLTKMNVGVAFLFFSLFLDMALVLVTAVGIGGYYFHRDDPSAPQYPAFTALGWAFSSSSGAVTESTFILMLVRLGEKWFDFSNYYACLCIFNPVWWVLKGFWCCLSQLLTTFSRFLLIMHGFHGGDFSTADTTRPTNEVLVKHLGKAFMSGVVGDWVLSFSATLVAVVFGLGTHLLLDKAEGIHAFTKAPYLFQLLCPCYFLTTHFWYKLMLPVLAILTMFRDFPNAEWLFWKPVTCCFAGVFVACVAKIVVQFFVEVCFHATDGLLYCYVLDAESGKPISDDMKAIHDAIQEAKGDDANQRSAGKSYGAVDDSNKA